MANRKPCLQDWKEWRRLRALALHEKGWSERLIAEAFGVAKGTVSKWLTVAHRRGANALRSRLSHGTRPKLTESQKLQIPDFLWHGPEAYGFRGLVWTCARVAAVIELEFGVRYHKDHVSRLLKELGWTPQVPLTRAIQRDEQAVEHWRNVVWPQLKKKPPRSSEP